MLTGAPTPTELEVSVFGPGVGESIVIHAGAGRWLVVDSCRSPKLGCVPLAYLRSIGVDVSKSVTDVIATHAHDDHIRGIAQLLEAAESAKFSVPTAATREEFMVALELDVELLEFRQRVFGELDETWSIVQGRGDTWKRCGEGREIRHFPSDVTLPEVSVRALSPSDHDLDASLSDLRSMITRLHDQTTRLASRDPNHFSMAIWLVAGPAQVLLGSDVLTGDSQQRGWDAVVATYAGRTKAQLYKVAHHGSVTGHHDGIWSQLCSEPAAIVTPYSPSGLPKDSDVARIVDAARRTFVTARGAKATREQHAVAASVQPLARNLRWLPGEVGHVRARCDLATGADWNFELDSIASEVA